MKKIMYIAFALLSLTACQGVSTKGQSTKYKVYGRYVPERKDDFAWENEYAAFRLYGAALKPENPSNGVDLWLKNSPALVVDTMYARELNEGRPYHINYDGNLDCYKVAHTAGAGGVVVCTESTMSEGKLFIGGPYDRYEILQQTCDTFVFRLEYDSLLVDDVVLRETITITAATGQLFNKAEVILSSKDQEPRTKDLLVGGGIYLHDTVDNVFICKKCGMIAYAEDALSDKQAAQMNYDYNGSTSQGRDYVAVQVPGATVQEIIDGTLVALKPYTLGDTLTYYFGACWSEWSDGEHSFPTDNDWFESLKK